MITLAKDLKVNNDNIRYVIVRDAENLAQENIACKDCLSFTLSSKDLNGIEIEELTLDKCKTIKLINIVVSSLSCFECEILYIKGNGVDDMEDFERLKYLHLEDTIIPCCSFEKIEKIFFRNVVLDEDSIIQFSTTRNAFIADSKIEDNKVCEFFFENLDTIVIINCRFSKLFIRSAKRVVIKNSQITEGTVLGECNEFHCDEHSTLGVVTLIQ